jgi:hypothetical protein
MVVDFNVCMQVFQTNATLRNQFLYTGGLQGIYNTLNSSKLPLLITYAGCRDVCGITPEYYSWEEASSTISNNVLPMLLLLLQAPYESNQFMATLLALARWLGNPVTSLSYILWNIRVTGRCAAMVDNGKASVFLKSAIS